MKKRLFLLIVILCMLALVGCATNRLVSNFDEAYCGKEYNKILVIFDSGDQRVNMLGEANLVVTLLSEYSVKAVTFTEIFFPTENYGETLKEKEENIMEQIRQRDIDCALILQLIYFQSAPGASGEADAENAGRALLYDVVARNKSLEYKSMLIDVKQNKLIWSLSSVVSGNKFTSSTRVVDAVVQVTLNKLKEDKILLGNP